MKKNNPLNPFYWLYNLQLKVSALNKLSTDNLELLKRVILDELNIRKDNKYKVSFKGVGGNNLLVYQRLKSIIHPLSDKKLLWTFTSVRNELQKRKVKEKEG